MSIGPETSHTDVSMSVWLCVGSLVVEGLSSQRLKGRLQFNVIVYLFHTFGKKSGGIIVAHVDEARQLAYLCIVDGEPRATWGGGWEIGKWPAVAKMHMVMEVRLDFK